MTASWVSSQLTVLWPPQQPVFSVAPAAWSAINETVVFRLAVDAGNLLGCGAGHPPGFFANASALIMRGNCTFQEKALNALNAGALSMVVYDYTDEALVTMDTGDAPSMQTVLHQFPSVFTSQSAGQYLVQLCESNNNNVVVALNVSYSVTEVYFRSPEYERAWVTLAAAACLAGVYWICRITWNVNQRARHVSATKRLKKQKYHRRNDEELAITDVETPRQVVFDTGNCPICIEDFNETQEVIILCCGHIIHPKCIYPWFDQGNDTCPLCKNVVLPIDPASPETMCSRRARGCFAGRTVPALFSTFFFLMMVGLFALFFS